MHFFDKIKNKLFPQDRAANPKVPLVSGPLKRSDRERASYFSWLNEHRYKYLIAQFAEAYQGKLKSEAHRLNVHAFQSPYANGFALTYHHDIGTGEFQHLFDHLKDKTLQLGYRLQIQERKMFDKGEYVETVEKYYLKPPVQDLEEGKLIDQLYGNILLENILIDDQPSYMKYLASIYSDRLYTKALPFAQLVDHLFDL